MTSNDIISKFNIITLQRTTSTQSYLKELALRKSLEEFTVVFTTNQTAGKGQGNHVWESEKNKNISFSLLLRPVFVHPSKQFQITQMLSLAVVDTIRRYIANGVKIKWPNDIYVGDKKICGILSQAQIIGDIIDSVYSGIGINVNQTKFLYAPNPVSLSDVLGKTLDLQEVLFDVLTNIYYRYEQLKNDSDKQKDEYLSLLLYRNQLSEYMYEGKIVSAEILSVNNYGHIIFRTSDGEIHQSDMQSFHYYALSSHVNESIM